eukprot:CAMPEP_0178583350 /NCGR_PEP_ID=MMETSP0697-20121206/24212_1 /TAXON_ID=265572 /ORGANISM="Extubocellulus spinifer, Strain CCMP396" /LENGTH=438 /DNA_ID=CAMNT_0020219145 /DNA_START=84 /DNA_END=1400 /DNA_ORIENTATION=+
MITRIKKKLRDSSSSRSSCSTDTTTAAGTCIASKTGDSRKNFPPAENVHVEQEDPLSHPPAVPPTNLRESLFSHVAHDLQLTGEELFQLRRIRATVDAAFDPMFTIDSTGRIVMANDAATAQFGYTYDEFIGSNISIICGGGHRDRHDEYMQRYLKTGVAHIIGKVREVPARRKDGTEFPVSLGVSEMKMQEGEDGENSVTQERYFCAYVRDLTEQKRQEKEILNSKALLQALIDSSFDPMFAINEHSIITVVNQAAVSLFGWTKEEFLGNDISMICGGGHSRRHAGYIQRYLETGQARMIGRRRQVPARRKDGSEFEIDLGIKEVTVGGKKIFTAFARDLTKHLQDQQTMLNQEHFLQDAFFCASKKKELIDDKSDGLLPGEVTPPLTPPPTPLSTGKTFARPSSPLSPPRPMRSPRQRSVSLGKHLVSPNMEDLSI